MTLEKRAFGNDFAWGVSTAAFQIEGAFNTDGKGLSIWDDFTASRGKILSNHHAQRSSDFYNRYRQDITLMSIMQIPNFRFSISWSRLFPSGTGAYNKQGVDYYQKVIDFCLESGIQPWITLYHWDLPLELEKKGGWTNREVINWFCDYVSFCIKHFGDRVKHWMILNEPLVFTGAGYFLGIHAPGKKGLNAFLASAHHAAICQAEGARSARAVRGDIKIGTTFSSSWIQGSSGGILDSLAAIRFDALVNRMFIEPLLGMGYPYKDLKVLQRLEQFVKDGDEMRLRFNMDFIGVQNYTREIISHSWLVPFLQAKIIKAGDRNVKRTMMNWEVYPESIYNVLKKFSAYPNIPDLIITENGAAFPDVLENGKIVDTERKEFIENYLKAVLKAKNERVNVKGYFIWSFTDNFEWAEGYHPRFGLVYVNFATQQRIVKYSGRWYSNFIST